MREFNPTTRNRTFAVAIVSVVLALAVWGCNKGAQQEAATARKERPRYEVPAALDRDLNPMELDSLRSMKISQKIKRDEYWDGYGGVLANDVVEVWYPDGKVNILQGAAMLKFAMAARARLNQLCDRVPDRHAVIICSGNVEMYTWATGRDWWTYSTIHGDTISVQAPVDLYTRGLLGVVGPREYYEWAIVQLSNERAPRWVQEGLASYLAGEGVILEDMRQDFVVLGPEAIAPDAMEKALKEEKERRETRRAYYNAYRMIEELARQHGEKPLGAWLDAMADEPDLDAATQRAFGVDYATLLKQATAWSGEQAQ